MNYFSCFFLYIITVPWYSNSSNSIIIRINEIIDIKIQLPIPKWDRHKKFPRKAFIKGEFLWESEFSNFLYTFKSHRTENCRGQRPESPIIFLRYLKRNIGRVLKATARKFESIKCIGRSGIWTLTATLSARGT